MKNYIKQYSKILSRRKWILIFLSFFFFFFAVVSYDLGVLLYLESINQEFFWAIILIIDEISIVIMPLLVTTICSKIGNLRFVKWATILLSVLFLLTFISDSIIYIIFILFPFFLRIYNNSLNPYISKTSEPDTLSLVFAIRDFFLYLGIAFGLLITSFLLNLNFPFTILIKVFGIVFLISAIFLILNKEEFKENKKIEKEKIFSFSLKDLKNRKILFILVGLFTGFSWVAFVISYFPLFLSDIGFVQSNIFFSYALAYFGVPFLAIFASAFANKKNSKKWYLVDIIIDIIPFTLLFFTNLGSHIIVIVVIFSQLRDFLRPIGIAYFFNNFEEHEQNKAWGFLGTFTSLISLPFPILIVIILGINMLLLSIITLIIICVTFFIAYLFLPNEIHSPKEELNQEKS